jgi:CDP-diacylglycerol---glycerol-3-phosphate 3-phosphatidyltransferase
LKITIPNQITIGRLGLAIVFFGLLSFYSAARGASQQWMLTVAFWLFLAAALLDVLDGALARWMKQVTTFGRVVDPVVDKVMVVGAFGFFASPHFATFVDGRTVNITGIMPWMVVVILMRELLVSAIRAHREAAGVPMPASWAGKAKMFVQSATVCVILGQLAWFDAKGELIWLRVGCIWLTLVVTVLSGVPYVRKAYAFLLSPPGEEAAAEIATPVALPVVSLEPAEAAAVPPLKGNGPLPVSQTSVVPGASA